MTTLLETLSAQLEAKRAEMRDAWTPVKEMQDGAAAGTFDPADPEQWKRFDEAGKKYDGLRDEVKELEGKRQRSLSLADEDGNVDRFLLDEKGRRGGDGAALWTPGKKFTESPIYEALIKSGRLRSDQTPVGTTDSVEVMSGPDLLATLRSRQEYAFKTLITEGAASGGAFVVPDYAPGYVDLLRRTVRLLDLIPTVPTESDLVDWVKQDTRTNAAAETAEAVATNDASGAAPESAAAFSLVSTAVQDITHFMAATKRAMADAGQLAGIIDTELRAGVFERLETQCLSGNGTAPNLRGILNTVGIGTQARGTDARSDAIHKAITVSRLAYIEPEFVVVHPTDAQTTFLEKDANGNYIYGPPSQPVRGSIWGLTPIITPAIAAGTALVANFARGCRLYLREGVSVSASDSHSDFFIRRLVAILAVIRAAFAVVRPAAFTTVTGM